MAALERAGELKKIRTPVTPILEIAEITDRVSKTSGPALLFQNVEAHPGSQVLINQFGSARRMNLALEVDSLDQVADRIRHFMDVKSPQGFLRSEEHTSELQSQSNLVCRLLLEKKKKK